jgi:hypothetical protein
MTTEIKERIVKYSKELRLPTFRGEFEVHASEAAKQEASYEEYLLGLMEKEYYTRVENRKKSQIRQAGFPQKHYLHDLQKELLPDNARQKLPLLERLDFIKEGRNVVLAGNPGTGKTHIATGLIAEPELNRQLNELKLNWKGVLDRDLIVLIQRDNLMQYTPDEMFSTEEGLDMGLLDDAADFQFLLIGKDGTVKMMSEEMVAHEKLFSTIDAMPMRKQEMRDN